MKFSITIPAYKAKYLKECIDSVLSQTYSDFELIIVNDASPEDLDSIVKLYSDQRIRYFKNEKNYGAINVVDNWNKCLSYAEGEYIICMGDDDRLLPSCLEEYMKLIQSYPELDVYHAWTEVINESSQIIKMQEPRPLWESVYSLIWNRWNGRIQYIGDFLFKTQTLKNNGGFYKFPLAWGSDDISAVIAAYKNGIANTQVPTFQYRVNSQTISKSDKNIQIKLDAINKEYTWYKNLIKIIPNENDTIDFTYWKMIKNYLPTYIAKKKAYQISEDFKHNFLYKLLMYIAKKNRFQVNFQIMGYALFLFLKKSTSNTN